MEAAHQAHFLTPSKRIVDADVKHTVHQRHGLGGESRAHQGIGCPIGFPRQRLRIQGHQVGLKDHRRERFGVVIATGDVDPAVVQQELSGPFHILLRQHFSRVGIEAKHHVLTTDIQLLSIGGQNGIDREGTALQHVEHLERRGRFRRVKPTDAGRFKDLPRRKVLRPFTQDEDLLAKGSRRTQNKEQSEGDTKQSGHGVAKAGQKYPETGPATATFANGSR